MPRILGLLLFSGVLALSACQSAIKDDANGDTEDLEDRASLPRSAEPAVMQATASRVVNSERDVVGYWVGMFEPAEETDGEYAGEQMAWDYSNKINLAIDSIGGGVVVGHSVVAGNLRPFRGTFSKEGERFVFEGKEPGDDAHDGAFRFEASLADTLIRGTWKAYKPVKIGERKYELTKQVFRYTPQHELAEDVPYVDWLKTKKNAPPASEDEDYYDVSYFTTTPAIYKHNASAKKLPRATVANLTKADIFIIRNAVYARHGYSFKNRQLRAFFDAQPWYIPVKVDVRDELTELEKENVALLLKFEKHAKEYYDEFGRG